MNKIKSSLFKTKHRKGGKSNSNIAKKLRSLFISEFVDEPRYLSKWWSENSEERLWKRRTEEAL